MNTNTKENGTRLGGPMSMGEAMRLSAENPESLLYGLAHAQGQATPAESFSLDELMDGFDVMKALHISQRTLQTLRSNRTLPYAKLGGKVYYRRRDIEKVLDDSFTMWRLNNPNGYGETRR